MFMAKVLIAVYILLTSSALVALKWGSKTGAVVQIAHSKLQLNLNLYIILGIALYGMSFVLYTALISKYDLGYIIPLTTAFVYAMIFTASVLIFKEVFTVTKIMGIVLVLGGVVLLNVKG